MHPWLDSLEFVKALKVELSKAIYIKNMIDILSPIN
jgi:hypothetical protein